MPTRAARSASASAIAWIFLASPSPRMRIFSASASASVWICAACCCARSYSALPWFDCTVIDELGLGDERLLLGARLGLAQLALLDRGLLLARVGLDLLLGDLARAQLGQDLLDLARPARRRSACRSAPPPARGCSARTSPSSPRRRCCWICAAVLDQLDQRARLADVLEVGRRPSGRASARPAA